MSSVQIKPAWFSSGFAVGFLGVALASRWAGARADRLGALDARFHAAYQRARTANSQRGAVLVFLGESLVLCRGDRRTQRCASAPATNLLKAAAHTPLGIFVLLEQHMPAEGAELDPITLARLIELRRMQLDAHAQLDGLDASARAQAESVLERSSRFVEELLRRRRLSAGELAMFASQLGPALLGLIDYATRLELDALHEATQDILREVPLEELHTLEVVVAGVHQARARSLGMQYFQKRFGEAAGEEKRVAYAESASDVTQAWELVGTRRLDREIALAFFGDAKRLQRDVLGDAAARLLERSNLERIA